jgi:hypothetical protein
VQSVRELFDTDARHQLISLLEVFKITLVSFIHLAAVLFVRTEYLPLSRA